MSTGGSSVSVFVGSGNPSLLPCTIIDLISTKFDFENWFEFDNNNYYQFLLASVIFLQYFFEPLGKGGFSSSES